MKKKPTTPQHFEPLGDGSLKLSLNADDIRGSVFYDRSQGQNHMTIIGAVRNAINYGRSVLNFDGVDDYLTQKVYANKVGDVTMATVATGALFNDTGQDFSNYAGASGNTPYMIVVTDTGGKVAWGYIGEQGTGETLGAEKLSNPSFETLGGGGADVFANWAEGFNNGTIEAAIDSVQNGTYAAKMTVGASSRPDMLQIISSAGGELYKSVFWCRGDGTNKLSYAFYGMDHTAFIKGYTSTANTTTTYAEKTSYVANFLNETRCRIQFSEDILPGTYVYVDNVSVKQVLTPTINGVKIYSAKNGSTQSWAGVDTGFLPNSVASYEVRKADFQITGALTVGAWVKGVAQTAKIIMSKYDSSLNQRSYMFSTGYIDATKARLLLSNSLTPFNGKNYETSITVFDNTWHFLVMTYDGNNTLKAFVDGAEDIYINKIFDTSITTIADSYSAFTVGALSPPTAGATAFAGSIDEPFVYNRALSASEICNLYNNTKNKYSKV